MLRATGARGQLLRGRVSRARAAVSSVSAVSTVSAISTLPALSAVSPQLLLAVRTTVRARTRQWWWHNEWGAKQQQ